MAVVNFDVATFRELYPEFSTASDTLLSGLFKQASTLYLNNTDFSPVEDITEREQLLFLLVAHLCYLRGHGSGGNGKTGSRELVGKITNASEGSVSVAVDSGGSNDESWWYLQSSYGAAFWQATAPYRTMRYYPGSSPSRYPAHYYRRHRGR